MPIPSLPPTLASYSDAPPAVPLNALFIHHSVGGQLLADPGPLENSEDSRRSLHRTHPNGGGLRSLLESQGYRVGEASYGSVIGEHTDLFDWLPKFRDSMPGVLKARRQDETFDADENQIVLFKSCYPNNAFRTGNGTGGARGPELTIANAKATLSAVREELVKHPRALFVYVTAPPLRVPAAEPAWKRVTKRMLGRPTRLERETRAAALAREFNDWVTSPMGWLGADAPPNLAVFDYFGLLAGDGNFLAYPSNGGTDNHPESGAQQRAAAALAPLLNRAVRRAGLGA